jgi:hypothetical protein
MPDNLTISIGADTSKVRGEIRLLQAQIQDLGRGLRAAVKTGDTAGAQGISQNIGRMQSQLAGLNRTLRETEPAAQQASRGIALTARSFKSLEGAALGVGKSFGGMQAGLAGLAVTLGAQGIGKLVGGVVEDLTKLQQVASNTGFKPADINAVGNAMLRLGVSTDATQQALAQFSKVAVDAKMKAGQLGNNFGVMIQRPADVASSGIVRLSGATDSFVRVLRGNASNAIKDFSDPLEQLGVKARVANKSLLEGAVITAQALQSFKKNNPLAAAGFGQELFGADWDKISQGLASVANSPAWKKLQEQAAILTGPEAMQRMADYNAAWGDLQIAINNTIQPLVIQLLPELTQLLNDLRPAILALAPDVKATFSEIIAFMQTTKQEVQGLIDIYNFLASTISSIVSAVGGAASAVGTALSNLPAAAGIPGGMASGGMVRGPGGPTSDSILARLSNGEFVMSAGAVQRWGAGLLASMNGGGTLIPRNGRYAEGGLVAAGGGAPVHLHLGGQSFALAGNQNVVDALVVEAHRHKIRSAGTKPSWYGGTPGR